MANETERHQFDATLTDDGLFFDGSGTVGPLPPLRDVDVERYLLRGEHGRGGLGVVMRALDRQLGREVAIKMLQNPSPEAGARFLREATITSRLQHPSIVTVLDVVRWLDGSPCYIMPLYPGNSFRVAIEAAGDLGARLALLPKVLAVAEAIAHAHERGVIHRDIKPSNVLLGSLGETVVIDWGVARYVDGPSDANVTLEPAADELDSTRVGQILGTPAYMAPEQARGDVVDRRADVYALGALIYHLLAKRTPYNVTGTAEALTKLLGGPPLDITLVVDGVPSDLAAIVRKAMAREPLERYPDGRALAGDLERFLSGHLVEAHSYSRWQLLWRWLRRHRVLSAAFLIVVAVVAVSFRRVQAERSAAQASAVREKLRGNAMILTQAETALMSDPTASIAWLKTYPLDGNEWTRVRGIARDAVRRGISPHVLHRQQGYENELLAWDDGRRALLVDGRRTMVLWDPVTGQRQHICLPDNVEGDLRDETFGRELVTLLSDGRLLVWNHDLSQSEHVATVPGAATASLSSDGRWIVVTAKTGLAQLVERATGAAVTIAEGDAPIDDARFVPGTDRVLLKTDSGVAELYDVSERQVVYVSMPGVGDTYISPYGRALVLERSGRIEWLDAETLSSRSLELVTRLFSLINFFRDGRVLATDERTQKSEIWNPYDGSVTQLPIYSGALAASPSGKLVAGFNPTGSVWTVDTATMTTRELRGHGHHTGRTVEFIGENTVASLIDASGARMWDVSLPPADGMILGRVPFEPQYVLLEDGQTLLMNAQDGRVLRRRLPDAQLEELFRVKGRMVQLVANADGSTVLVLVNNGDLHRYDGHSGKLDKLFTEVPPVHQIEVTRDGRHAIGISFLGDVVLVWDLEHRTSRRLEGLNGYCEKVAISPDQRTGVISCSTQTSSGFTLVDLVDGTTRHLATPHALARVMGFSPSGRYLFGMARNGTALRWELGSGALVTRRLQNAEAQSGVPLSDDLLLTTGSSGLLLSVFSLGLSRVIDPTSDILNLYVSPDRRVAAGIAQSRENGISLWDLVSGESWSIPRYTGRRQVQFTRDGGVVAAGRDGQLRIFAPPATLAASPERTKAWLDTLTSVQLDDEQAPRSSCE